MKTSMALAALAVLSFAAACEAQGLPFSDVAPSPTVSPYLNLLNNNNGRGLPSYQTLVRPIVQAQQQAAVQRSQINNLQRQTQSLGQTMRATGGASLEIRGTGHATSFMNYSHFYPQRAPLR